MLYNLSAAGQRFETTVFPIASLFPTTGFWVATFISIIYPIKQTYVEQNVPLLEKYKMARPSVSYTTYAKRNSRRFKRMLKKKGARRRFKEYLAMEFSVENLRWVLYVVLCVCVCVCMYVCVSCECECAVLCVLCCVCCVV